jgi:hypothetical protein
MRNSFSRVTLLVVAAAALLCPGTMVLRLLPGVAAGNVACSGGSGRVPDMTGCQCPEEEPTDGCSVEVACTSAHACRDNTLDATGARGDLVLTCSGYFACYQLIVLCPPSPHACDVRCTGSGEQTCKSIEVRAEKAAQLAFACGTSGDYCGWNAKLACPTRTAVGQHAQVAGELCGAAAPPAGGPTCAVTCTSARIDYGTYFGHFEYLFSTTGTCYDMTVKAGQAGASVVCADEDASGGAESHWTCKGLQLLPPAGAAVAAAAPLTIDCSTCTSGGNNPCCLAARVRVPTTSCSNNGALLTTAKNTELHCGPRAYCYDPGTFYDTESEACAELTAPPTPTRTPAEQCQNSINKHCTPAAVAAAVQQKDTGECCLPQSEAAAYNCI